MTFLEKANKDLHFRTTQIRLMARICNYFYQYHLKDGKVKVSIISVPSDDKENMIISYVQFNPAEIDLEDKLYTTSDKVYNIEDQLFMVLRGSDSEVIEKSKMMQDYLLACIN